MKGTSRGRPLPMASRTPLLHTIAGPPARPSGTVQRRKRDFYTLLDRYMREHTVTQAELLRAAEEMWRANEYCRQETALRRSAARGAPRAGRRKLSYAREAHEVAMRAAGGRNWSQGRPNQLSRIVRGGLPGLGKHHH